MLSSNVKRITQCKTVSSALVLLIVVLCYNDLFCVLHRGAGEVLSEEAITTIHSKLKRSKEERLETAKVKIFLCTYACTWL